MLPPYLRSRDWGFRMEAILIQTRLDVTNVNLPAIGGPTKLNKPAKNVSAPKASASMLVPTNSATITDVRDTVTPEKQNKK